MAGPAFIALYLEDGTIANTAPCADLTERKAKVAAFLDDARDHEELVILDTGTLDWRSYATWNPDDEEPETQPYAVEIEVRRKFWVKVDATSPEAATEQALAFVDPDDGATTCHAEEFGEQFDVERDLILTRPLEEFAEANGWENYLREHFGLLTKDMSND